MTIASLRTLFVASTFFASLSLDAVAHACVSPSKLNANNGAVPAINLCDAKTLPANALLLTGDTNVPSTQVTNNATFGETYKSAVNLTGRCCCRWPSS